MATKANSISVAKLSTAAHAAAKAALAKAELDGVKAEPGVIFNHPWIIGIIIRNPVPAQAEKYQRVAEHVTSELAKAELNPQPLPPAAAATYHYDHVIVCGYRPVDEQLTVLE